MSDPATGPVAVTGISGNLGRALARRLAETRPVVGIDHRPLPEEIPRVEHWQLDLRKARVEELFAARQLAAVIHLAVVHDRALPTTELHELNVVGTRRILDLCARHRVPKVVLLSSANVYGPAPDNSSFLAEETPLLGTTRRGDLRDLVEIDMHAQSFLWRHPEIDTVVLRPVNVVGPTVRSAPARYLRLARPVTALGFDPMIQLIHEADVCRAMVLALRPGARGVFNVVGPGQLPLSAILRELGRAPVPVPHFLLRPTLRLLGEDRLFPADEVDHLQYPCTVDGVRAVEELGWEPSRTLRETIRSVLD